MKFAVLFVSLLSASTFAQTSTTSPLDDWREVLASYVDEVGRTDFTALAENRAGLDRYVAWLAQNGPNTTPQSFTDRAEILAYHINAYNALAMHGVLERDIPKNFSSFFKRASFFRFRKIVVDGDETNLYDYENDVIRPLGEPRVHFVLNCMVRSCPRLPRTAFAAHSLETDLKHLTEAFFADPKHLRIDAQRGLVMVSSILDFYTGDFVASDSPDDLLPYINQHLQDPIPANYRVGFLDYNWEVNQQP